MADESILVVDDDEFMLESCDGNRTTAADMLGISSRTLRNKLHKYGMAGIFRKGVGTEELSE